jgi:hypothetical protein
MQNQPVQAGSLVVLCLSCFSYSVFIAAATQLVVLLLGHCRPHPFPFFLRYFVA